MIPVLECRERPLAGKALLVLLARAGGTQLGGRGMGAEHVAPARATQARAHRWQLCHLKGKRGSCICPHNHDQELIT